MLSSRRLQAFAVAPILLGLVNFAALGYALATYEPRPADGGTSIFGLFVGIIAVLAGLVVLEAVVAACFARFVHPSRWVYRLTAAALLGTTVAGVGLTVWYNGTALGLNRPASDLVVISAGIVVGGVGLLAAAVAGIADRRRDADGVTA